MGYKREEGYAVVASFRGAFLCLMIAGWPKRQKMTVRTAANTSHMSNMCEGVWLSRPTVG